MYSNTNNVNNINNIDMRMDSDVDTEASIYLETQSDMSELQTLESRYIKRTRCRSVFMMVFTLFFQSLPGIVINTSIFGVVIYAYMYSSYSYFCVDECKAYIYVSLCCEFIIVFVILLTWLNWIRRQKPFTLCDGYWYLYKRYFNGISDNEIIHTTTDWYKNTNYHLTISLVVTSIISILSLVVYIFIRNHYGCAKYQYERLDSSITMIIIAHTGGIIIQSVITPLWLRLYTK